MGTGIAKSQGFPPLPRIVLSHESNASPLALFQPGIFEKSTFLTARRHSGSDFGARTLPHRDRLLATVITGPWPTPRTALAAIMAGQPIILTATSGHASSG